MSKSNVIELSGREGTGDSLTTVLRASTATTQTLLTPRLSGRALGVYSS